MAFRLSFRKLQRSDLDRVKQLHNVSFPLHYEQSFFDSLCDPASFNLVAIAEHTEGANQTTGTTIPAADGGAKGLMGEGIVGVITGKVKYVDGLVHSTPVGYISTFCVDPAYRQHGVGSQLLEKFVTIFFDLDPLAPRGALLWSCLPVKWRPSQRLRQVWLHCLATDEAVVSFYRRRQFLLVETIPRYYRINGKEEPSNVMCREKVSLVTVVGDATKYNKRKAMSLGRGCWEWFTGPSNVALIEEMDEVVEPTCLQPPLARGCVQVTCCAVALVFIAAYLLWRLAR